MDLPINNDELNLIIESLKENSDSSSLLLRDRLRLVQLLIQEGKPYKKILREEYGIVA